MKGKQLADCTVVVLAFNLEDYILDCLNSIEAQETSHSLKVLVHDDCSTDRTLKVVKDFASRSKLKFEIVIPGQNQYKKGMGFFYDLLLTVDTKYIAILDGDDVWSDKSKLQIQIDQLESNPALAMSTHVFSIVTSDLQTEIGTWPNKEFRAPIGRSVDLARENYIGALTAVFRRDLLPESMCGYDALGTNDYPIWGLLSSFGDIGFVDRNMARYRQHATQMYANRSDDSRGRVALECKIFVANNMVRGELRDAWVDSIRNDILGNGPELIKQLREENTRIKSDLELSKEELARSTEELARSKDMNDHFSDESEILKQQIELFDKELQIKAITIDKIYRSFSWRITSPVRKFAVLVKKKTNR